MPKIQTPPKVQVTVRIDEDVLQRFEDHAQNIREPKSVILQRVLLNYLDSVKAPWPHDPNDPSSSDY